MYIKFVGQNKLKRYREHRVEQSLFPNSDTRCLFVECAFSVYAEERADFLEGIGFGRREERGLNFARAPERTPGVPKHSSGAR